MTRSNDGTWWVTLDARERQTVYDNAGVVTELSMDEWVPLGAFGDAATGSDELRAPPEVRMWRVRSGSRRSR